MTRWKASAIHLSLSAIVLAAIAAVVVFRWYPPGLFHIARADTLLVLIGGVDLVLGPLLTLIVYTQGKKGLRFDLTVIALLQLAALVYGLNTVWQSRPVFLVASDTRLTLLFANEMDRADLGKAPPRYRDLPAFGARTVAVTTPDALTEVIRKMTGNDARRHPANYRPYSEIAIKLASGARPIAGLIARLPPGERASLERAMKSSGRTAIGLGLVPVVSSRGRAAMLIDTDTGELLRPVDASITVQ